MLITQLAVVFLAAFSSTRANDSLKEAYHAVQKRADRLSSSPVVYYSRPYMYGDGQPEDIGYGYQKNLAPEVQYDNAPINYGDLAREEFDERAANALEKLLLDYIEESKGPRSRYSDRVSGNIKRSVFRERDPDTIQRAFEDSELAQPSPFRERGKLRPSTRLHGLPRGGESSNPGPYALPSAREALEEEEYVNAINQVLDKYREEQDPEEMTEEDLEDVLEYLGAGKDNKKRPYGASYSSPYEAFNAPMTWKRSGQSSHHKRAYDGLFDERYPYRGLQKRFPISKRSPSYYPLPLERKKKSEVKTDAKTAAELNNIFDTTPNSSATTTRGGTKAPKTEKPTVKATAVASANGPGQKEQALVGTQAGKPLELKKKSIDWSQYFGLDRKKKSSDWMVDQYLRQYGLSPLAKRMPQQQTADDVDSKMLAMEDMIVDQAIKLTGAHEGTKDPKELKRVKEKLEADLRTAYNLEKMRLALGEFRESIAAQKAVAPSSHSISGSKSLGHEMKMKEEEKKERIATSPVPKIDKKLNTEPKLRNSILNFEENNDDCPVIDAITERCETLSSFMRLGRKDKFLQVCGFHQLCSACGVMLGAVEENQCNQAYINENIEICDGDEDCLKQTLEVLMMLQDSNRASSSGYSRLLKKIQPINCDYWSNPCLSNILPSFLSRRR
uniref:Uncharacterized protein n=1 Tax=Lygus hesperus TaxID=30085 RepID=A0A0A9X073_LYGHE